jgi:DNA-binding transcriptional ArsR family regulator
MVNCTLIDWIDAALHPVSETLPASSKCRFVLSKDRGHARHRVLASSMIVTYLLQMMHALDALGNPMRRAILHELRAGPRSVGQIAAALPVSRPAISRHLRVLEEAGLVQNREEGTRNLYSVRMLGFASVREFVDAFWDTALARLEELARQ